MDQNKPKNWDPPDLGPCGIVTAALRGAAADPLAWVPTFTGRQFFPWAPTSAMFNVADIAHGLSLVNRFEGATVCPYSVAQHSVMVSRACSGRDAVAGLFHDAAEAYVGDVPRPVKMYLPEFRAMEDAILLACSIAYGFDFPLPVSVKRADRDLLATEWRDLVKTDLPDWPFETVPLDQMITPWHAGIAEEKFVERYNELVPTLGEQKRKGG